MKKQDADRAIPKKEEAMEMRAEPASRQGRSIMERFKMGEHEGSRYREWRWAPEKVKRDAVVAEYGQLRRMVLHNLGVITTRNAENLIVTGCVVPFGMTLQLLAFFRLLDRLQIKYNIIREREYCCGVGWVQGAKPSEYEAALEYSKQAMQLNVAQTRELGAKKMFYFCYMCCTLGKKFFINEEIEQKYFLDILVGKLEKETLRVKPTTIGYYEGCWARSHIINPKLDINLAAYRKWLDRIEGLRIVEMPHRTCCVMNPSRVLDAAEANRVDCIVTPCTGCFVFLDRASRGRIPIRFLPELLLDAMPP